jgi:hypothetical protein
MPAVVRNQHSCVETDCCRFQYTSISLTHDTFDHLFFVLQDDYPGSLHLTFLSAAHFDQLGVSGSMQLFDDRLQVCGLCEFYDI